MIPKSIVLPVADCIQVGASGAKICDEVLDKNVAPIWASSNCAGSILKSPPKMYGMSKCAIILSSWFIRWALAPDS